MKNEATLGKNEVELEKSAKKKQKELSQLNLAKLFLHIRQPWRLPDNAYHMMNGFRKCIKI